MHQVTEKSCLFTEFEKIYARGGNKVIQSSDLLIGKTFLSVNFSIKRTTNDITIVVEQITNIYNYYVSNDVATFETDPVIKEEMEGRIQKIFPKFLYLVSVIKDKEGEEYGEIVTGYFYANTFRSRAAYD